jgi:cytochrome o ubiquinol oxidase operon protein cyoD
MNRHMSLGNYIAGYIFSVLLTVEAYLLVSRHTLGSHVLLVVILALALVQFAVQVIFFLHLGEDATPRWRQLSFAFMLLVVIILVLGSLWIMHNLNYHMLSPEHVNQYLNSQDGL